MSIVSLTDPLAIKAAIKRSLASDEDDELSGSWRAPNGRRFDIRRLDMKRWFLAELRPISRVCTISPERKPLYRDEPRLTPLLDNPNGFLSAVRAAGLDPEEIIYDGAGYNCYTRYFSDLDDLIQALISALTDNCWYDSIDTEKHNDPAFNAKLEAEQRAFTAAHRAEEQQLWETSRAGQESLFKGLYNAFGPLDKEIKERILSFLNAPSKETWEAAYSICIRGVGYTLWQAWRDVDPAAPASRPLDGTWPRLPDPEIIRTALLKAGALSPEEHWQACRS